MNTDSRQVARLLALHNDTGESDDSEDEGGNDEESDKKKFEKE